MQRREFLGSLAQVGVLAALSGCMSTKSGAVGNLPKDFAWAFLVHFGLNMWDDTPVPLDREEVMLSLLTDEEFSQVSAPGYGHFYTAADHVRFDEAMWRSYSETLRKAGCNALVIDCGEFVKYPSHPELAVKGSWEPERMKAEVLRLRGMGFEVIPKLNFSTCHDIWLKEYSWMISTAKYHQVCADVIRDTYEIFDRPKNFHLGLDEEDLPAFQTHQQVAVIRHGERWWKDVYLLIGEVERLGARPWMWSDWAFHNDVEEFIRKIPRSVMQNPWTYGLRDEYLFDESKIKVMDRLGEAGLDIVPCGSNCFGCIENFHALAEHALDHLPSGRFKGMMMAPWLQMRAPYGRLLDQAADIMSSEIRLFQS